VKRYGVFAILVIVCVVADLGTKTMAENRLASSSRDYNHFLYFDVPEATTPGTLAEFLAEEFARNTPDEIDRIALNTVLLDGEGAPRRSGLPDLPLEGGEHLEVRRRSVQVMGEFLGFRYVENRGAAWGFLGDAPASVRQPFFIIIGLVAIVVIFLMFRSIEPNRRFLMTALAFIVGGALGNIIDRIRYGYVVDFIDWYPGFRWPTFNIADVVIVAGVSMMFIEVIRDHRRERRQKEEQAAAEEASAEA